MYVRKSGFIIYRVYFEAHVVERYQVVADIVKKFESTTGSEPINAEESGNRIVISNSKESIKVIVKNEGTLAIDLYKQLHSHHNVKTVYLRYSKESLLVFMEILRFLGVLKSDYKIKQGANDFIEL